MKDILKRTKLNLILTALLTVILGVVLIIWPASATVFLCTVAGWLLLLTGLIITIVHFVKQPEENTGLAVGIICTALGFWVVLRPTHTLELLSALFGMLLLLHGFFDMQDAITVKKAAVDTWWVYGLFALITILCGVFVIWAPLTSAIASTVVTGAALVFDGITDLILVVRISKLDKQAAAAAPTTF